ncbi:MAG TPA: ABC transporter permease [Planctomycetota bacterium]|nr:ABC transporter permease [Planctomycetota bacterium]
MSATPMLLRFALRGVARQARRSLLTGLSLAGGIFVIVLLGGLQDGYVADRMEAGLGLQLGHLRVEAGERPLPDPLALADALVADGTAVAAAPRFRQPCFLLAGDKAQGALALGVDPEHEQRLARLPGLVREGSFLSESPEASPIVLGRTLAESLGVGLGDSVTLNARRAGGGLGSGTFTVGGLFETGGGLLEANLCVVRREALAPVLGRSDGADEVALRLDDPWRAPAVAAELAARPDLAGLRVLSWREMAPELAEAMEVLHAMERIRTGVLFALVALGIYTTLTLALSARRREFGMLLALGMSPARLLVVLALELLLVEVAAVALGLALAAGVIAWLHARGLDLAALGARLPGALEGAAVLRPVFAPDRALLAAAWAAAVAFVVLLVPALRLLRLDPAAVLRERG